MSNLELCMIILIGFTVGFSIDQRGYTKTFLNLG